MKKCAARPYEGSEKYVFVSYCHKDKAQVYPIIEKLAKDGIRVWYDEGIDPGSEWPEIIANHLNNSSICIAFITKNSINSHNCRREINFALQKQKLFISVVLEPVELSLGMQMQLSATQAIFSYKLSTASELFLKLYDVKAMYGCKGNPHPEIEVSKPEDWDEDKEVENSEVINTDEDTDNIKYERVNVIKAQFYRDTTAECYRLKEGDNYIGRSNECQCIISGNGAIGRKHAIIRLVAGRAYLIDNNSVNRTFLNSIALEPEKEYELADGDIFKLCNEKFRFEINV